MTAHIRTIFICLHVLRDKIESLGKWKNLNLSYYSFSAFQYVLGYRLLQLHIFRYYLWRVFTVKIRT